MDLKQYVADATKTESQIDLVRVDVNLLASVLQIMIASGKMLDQIKKNVFYQRDYNNDALVMEFQLIVSSLDSMRDVLLNGQNPEAVAYRPRVFHSIVGIATEAVELLEALGDENFDRINFLEELGDLNWYEAIGIDAVSGDFDEVLETNIAKLRKRYADKFSEEAANNRDLDAEREVLKELDDLEVNPEDGC